MKRGGPLKRTQLRKQNRKRLQRRFTEQFDSPAFISFVSALPCVVCGEGPCDAAHVRSRGAGGKACDIAPLCRDCHRLQHDLGIVTFGNLYGLSLRDAASRTWASWQALQGVAA